VYTAEDGRVKFAMQFTADLRDRQWTCVHTCFPTPLSSPEMSAKRKATEIICRCIICGINGVARSPEDDLTHRLESLSAMHPHAWAVQQTPVSIGDPISVPDTRSFHVRKRQRLEEDFDALALEAKLLEATMRTLVRAHTGVILGIDTMSQMRASAEYQQASRDAESLRERARRLPISYHQRDHGSLAHTIARIFLVLTRYRPPGRIPYSTGESGKTGRAAATTTH
jgi:hypothetical protein